jgi:uncharacterized protein (TIGR02679 family)
VHLLRSGKGLGLLKRLARQDPDAAQLLCQRADLVLARLPAHGQPRAQLAAEALGDAHALDSGAQTATLVLATLKQDGPLVDVSEPQVGASGASEGDAPDEDDRARWARAGVLVNELARPALILNLPLEAGATFAGDAGEPAYATLRQLLRATPQRCRPHCLRLRESQPRRHRRRWPGPPLRAPGLH